MSCAQTQGAPRALTPITEDRTIGDYDGDGRSDIAGWFEDAEGHLVVAVYRAAAREPDILWGGDISSEPYFTLRAAPPGAYHTNCEAYGDCNAIAAETTLNSDGLIVEGSADGSRTLYFWRDGAFRDVSIRE